MSKEDEVREKEQKLSEIKEFMSQFQEKLTSTTRELKETQEKLASTTRELEEARNLSNTDMNNIKKLLDDSNAKNSVLEKQLQDINSVITDLNRRIKELEDILSQKENEIQKLKELLIEKDKIISQQTVQVSQTPRVPKPEQKLVLEPQESLVEITSGESIVCPECGAVGVDIKTTENRDKILEYLDHKPIYAKKYICRKCGHEF